MSNSLGGHGEPPFFSRELTFPENGNPDLSPLSVLAEAQTRQLFCQQPSQPSQDPPRQQEPRQQERATIEESPEVATLNADDDDLSSTTDGDQVPGNCEAFYIKNGNSKGVLLAMAIGLTERKDGGRKLGDMTLEPYASMKKNKLKVHPQADHLRNEVTRRAVWKEIPKNKMPKPKAWPKKNCIDWLEKNPILSGFDADWVRAEEMKYYTQLIKAAEEVATRSNSRENWIGIRPWARLMMCLLHDDARSALLSMNDCMDHGPCSS